MNVGIYLSIRNKATRLPGKSLLPFAGKPLVAFLLERLKTIAGPEAVVLCTSDSVDDQVLIEWAKSCGVSNYQGSKEDKLNRYLMASKKFGHDNLVIIDGDDPFISVHHAKKTLVALQDPNIDLVLYDNLPVGAMAFGLKSSLLEQYFDQHGASSTEVWAPILRQLPNLRELTLHETDPSLVHSSARLTLDYPEDYNFCCEVIKKLSQSNREPSYKNLLSLLKEFPDLVDININANQQYQDNLARLIQKEKVGKNS